MVFLSVMRSCLYFCSLFVLVVRWNFFPFLSVFLSVGIFEFVGFSVGFGFEYFPSKLICSTRLGISTTTQRTHHTAHAPHSSRTTQLTHHTAHEPLCPHTTLLTHYSTHAPLYARTTQLTHHTAHAPLCPRTALSTYHSAPRITPRTRHSAYEPFYARTDLHTTPSAYKPLCSPTIDRQSLYRCRLYVYCCEGPTKTITNEVIN